MAHFVCSTCGTEYSSEAIPDIQAAYDSEEIDENSSYDETEVFCDECGTRGCGNVYYDPRDPMFNRYND